MELAQIERRAPAGPIVVVIAVLALVALALTAWYAVLRTESRPMAAPYRAPATVFAVCSGLVAPDALDRCEQQVEQKQSAAEAHHGH